MLRLFAKGSSPRQGPAGHRRWSETAAANGLIDATEATGNPYVLVFALHAYGWAVHDADPVRSLAALRRALAIAQDSGNRSNESQLAGALARLEAEFRLEAEYGDPLVAFDYFTVAIRNLRDAGNTSLMRGALAVLTVLSTGSEL